MTDEQALQIALVERAKRCEQEREELRARLLTAEHESDALRARFLTAENESDALRARFRAVENERDALRARLRAVEQRQRAALGELVKRNDGFIRSLAARIVRRYGLPVSAFDDIAQEIRVGMIYAVGKFDPERGVGFLSYASWWCKSYAMRAAIGPESTSPVLCPAHIHHGKETPIDPHAAAAARRLRAVPIHGATPDEIPLVDRLASDEPTPEEVAERQSVARNRRRILARVVAKLSDREREIAVERLLGSTYETAGGVRGVTRSRAQQIGAKVIELAQVAEAQQRAAERKRVAR